MPQPDLFVLALEEWRGRASKPFPGLEPGTAELLLSWAARGHGWQPTHELHRVGCLNTDCNTTGCHMRPNVARMWLMNALLAGMLRVGQSCQSAAVTYG